MFNCGTTGGKEEKKKERNLCVLVHQGSGLGPTDVIYNSLFTLRQLFLKKPKCFVVFGLIITTKLFSETLSRVDQFENAALLVGFWKRAHPDDDSLRGTVTEVCLMTAFQPSHKERRRRRRC